MSTGKTPLHKWIWLLLTLGLAIPLLYPLGITVSISQGTQDFYDVLEGLPTGSLVVIKADPSPGFYAEFRPWFEAILVHLATLQHKLCIFTSNDYSVTFNERSISDVLPELDALGWAYGTDYVHLGYIPGVVASTAIMSETPQQATINDARNNPVMSLPLMQEYDSGDDVAVIVTNTLDNLSSALTYFKEVYGTKVLNTIAGAAFSELIAFYHTGQTDGIIPAIHGSAEYEQLTGRIGLASAQMDAQSLGHIIVLIGLIAGNVIYFMRKARGEEDVRIGWAREV
jgi:hypothetical protein